MINCQCELIGGPFDGRIVSIATYCDMWVGDSGVRPVYYQRDESGNFVYMNEKKMEK
jgi:hypothetical protein